MARTFGLHPKDGGSIPSRATNFKEIKLNNPLIRWWVVFCSICFIVLIMAVNGGFSYIANNDSTYISWLVLLIFSVGSIHLGYKSKRSNENTNYSATKYFSQTCGSLGMLGTIVGLMISMSGAFSGVDASNTESIKTALTTIAQGTGAALTTTMVGMLCALFLEAQLATVSAKWRS